MKIAIILLGLTTVAITVSAAIFDGVRDFRWGQDQRAVSLAANLEEHFPKDINGWKSVSDIELDKTSTTMLSPFGFINRRYQKGERSAQLFILLGPTGPTVVHTPDICYDVREYQKMGDRVAITLEDNGATKSKCWQTRFKHRRVDRRSPYLSSWYAWTIDGTWHCPELPRVFFANQRILFKIQVVSEYSDQNAMTNDQEMTDFINEIVRQLRKKVIKAAEASSGKKA